MTLETSNKIKITEDDIIDAYCPDGLASYQTGEHCVYISKADSIHEAEQIKAQIVSALKLQEIVQNLTSDQVEDWIIESQHGKYLEDGTNEQKLCDCIKSLIKESEK